MRTPLVRRTWFIEQLVLGALVLGAVGSKVWPLATRHALTPEIAFHHALWALVIIGSQKLRSMADRQREQDELHGVKHAPMSCAERVSTWAFLVQIASAVSGLIDAQTWWHWGVGVFSALYVPVIRAVYRRFVPARIEGGPSETAVPLTDSTSQGDHVRVQYDPERRTSFISVGNHRVEPRVDLSVSPMASITWRVLGPPHKLDVATFREVLKEFTDPDAAVAFARQREVEAEWEIESNGAA